MRRPVDTQTKERKPKRIPAHKVGKRQDVNKDGTITEHLVIIGSAKITINQRKNRKQWRRVPQTRPNKNKR